MTLPMTIWHTRERGIGSARTRAVATSALDHSRRFGRVSMTSALPPSVIAQFSGANLFGQRRRRRSARGSVLTAFPSASFSQESRCRRWLRIDYRSLDVKISLSGSGTLQSFGARSDSSICRGLTSGKGHGLGI
jgi:hypothetical protein